MGRKKNEPGWWDDYSFQEQMELELKEFLKNNPERTERDFEEWWVKKQQRKNKKWMA